MLGDLTVIFDGYHTLLRRSRAINRRPNQKRGRDTLTLRLHGSSFDGAHRSPCLLYLSYQGEQVLQRDPVSCWDKVLLRREGARKEKKRCSPQTRPGTRPLPESLATGGQTPNGAMRRIATAWAVSSVSFMSGDIATPVDVLLLCAGFSSPRRPQQGLAEKKVRTDCTTCR
jgi:hypothetical protein